MRQARTTINYVYIICTHFTGYAFVGLRFLLSSSSNFVFCFQLENATLNDQSRATVHTGLLNVSW